LESGTVQTCAQFVIVKFRRGLHLPQTTLLRLVKTEEAEGGVFDSEDIAVMTTAFDRLLADFKLTNRDDPVVTMLAKLVIEMVRNGESDPERVRKLVTARYKL
jgi:hypothetical protein